VPHPSILDRSPVHVRVYRAHVFVRRPCEKERKREPKGKGAGEGEVEERVDEMRARQTQTKERWLQRHTQRNKIGEKDLSWRVPAIGHETKVDWLHTLTLPVPLLACIWY